MLLSLVKMLFAVGVGINAFVIIQLIRREELPSLPSRIGLAIASLWAFRFLLLYIKFEPWALEYPFLLVIDQNLFLLDPVLLWMYARSIIRPIRWNFFTLLHFIPFTIGFLSAISNTLLYPAEIVEEYNRAVDALLQGDSRTTVGVVVIIAIIILISVFYFAKSVIEVKRYDASLKDQYSNIENLKIGWVASFQRLWILLFVLPLLLYFMNYIFPAIDMMVTGGVLMTSLILLSVFFNSNLLSQSYVSDVAYQKKASENTSSELTPDDKLLLDKLHALLTNDRYYENEQLSLDQLAEHMQLKPIELTELIKKSEYDNFYDLINSYRIDAVKQSLVDSSEQIIVIAYQCGFNSKSAFNKIFKEKTGHTPREYRMSLK